MTSTRALMALVAIVASLALGGCSYFGRDVDPYRPPAGHGGIADGAVLYMKDCAWCHGNEGGGTERGPDLLGGTNGTALTHFTLSTGRMPLTDPEQRSLGGDSIYSEEQVLAIAEFLAGLGQSGPEIPDLDLTDAPLPAGLELYQDNCAACHATTGIGGALTTSQRDEATEIDPGIAAPDVFGLTPLQIAEAVRTGPGTMPVFGEGTFDDSELEALARYVDYLDRAPDLGGAPLGRVGPVTEGAVGWVVGVVALLAFARWIGTRAGEP